MTTTPHWECVRYRRGHSTHSVAILPAPDREAARDEAAERFGCGRDEVLVRYAGNRVDAAAVASPVTLPYPPTLNHLYATVRGRKVLSREGRTYKETAATMLAAQGVRPLAGDVTVHITVYRPRRAGDLDNFFKVAFDSVKGIGWHDDKQVTEIHAYRRDDKHNPRIELRITPAITKEGPQ